MSLAQRDPVFGLTLQMVVTGYAVLNLPSASIIDVSIQSITFHKRETILCISMPGIDSQFTAHPDSFIHPKMLKEFSKKLKKYYGWIPEDLD